MNDVAVFWKNKQIIDEAEKTKKEAEELLKEIYPKLIEVCPHPEAITWSLGLRGTGNWVVCKVCGLEDHALIGATPGDEYDYGYAGHMDRDFWKNTVIEQVTEKESWQYRRRHHYQVVGGKVVNKL